jgi:F-type H+-transporting ATPase subunit gamma
MTGRLSDITDRIEGVRQLDSVVGAMTGIASARARIARAEIAAVDRYASTVAAAIGRVGMGKAGDFVGQGTAPEPLTLVVFCAEQGFVGAFSERVLDFVAADLATADIFLIGTRGGATAAERGIVPLWQAGLPSHSASIPKFADRLVQVVLDHMTTGNSSALEVIHTVWRSGAPHIERKVLFPADPAPQSIAAVNAPLTNLPVQELLEELGADYLHAQLCHAALHAFAAENEARMIVMTKAQAQIERELGKLEATERRVRQEEITAEIIEIAAGEMASRHNHQAGVDT